MQNSLNQAFIRAYAKERDAAHAQAANQAADSQAATQRANEQLIMRFDTTTVEVPHSHLNTRPATRQTVAVAPQATASSTATAQARPARTAEDELRATIASEMLRAGGWQDEQIASLGPIAPSPIAAPIKQTRAPELDRPVASITEDAEPQPLQFEREAIREPMREPAPQQPDFVHNVKSGSIVRLDQPLAPPSNFDKTNAPGNASEAPVSRAASQALQQAEHPTKQQVERPVERKTEPLDAYDSRYEDHYRIDRYDVENPSNTAKSDAGVQPIKIAAGTVTAAASGAAVGTAASRDSMARNRKAASASTAKQVERELRRAKVRVFNPIWEVDQLQWPDVCVQLMNARMDSLSHVTKHLSDACQEGLQVLAVTSPEGGEGRTTVACCLAMLAGSRGLKVAIVDGDIENPTLCLQTNLEMENDWQSAILNEIPLEEVAVHSIDDQITLVPLLNPVDQSELPNTDQRIADMLIELSESFDLVIVDIGHMNSPGGLMQSLAEQGIINAAIAVVDQRNASSTRIETCIRRIRQAGVTSIGLVENFAA